MNRYESFSIMKEGLASRMRTALSGPGNYAWCGIDEFISNPDIFPLQPATTWSAEGRRLWAKTAKRQGCRFVCSHPSYGEFRLSSTNRVPPLNMRHISKVWRDCK